MKNCIYKIQSIVNGRIYVGSAVNVYKRKFLHFNSLKHNKHHNSKLQNHYNKHGKSDLMFEVIESECEDLIAREQFYIDTLNPFFNICKIAGSCIGRKHKEETKNKISIALKGREYTAERRENMSKASKGKKKKPFSESHLKNIKKAAVGKNKGRISTLRKAVIGMAEDKEVLEYTSIKQAAEELKTSRSNIIHSIKNGHKAKGYNWKYKYTAP